MGVDVDPAGCDVHSPDAPDLSRVDAPVVPGRDEAAHSVVNRPTALIPQVMLAFKRPDCRAGGPACCYDSVVQFIGARAARPTINIGPRPAGGVYPAAREGPPAHAEVPVSRGGEVDGVEHASSETGWVEGGAWSGEREADGSRISFKSLECLRGSEQSIQTGVRSYPFHSGNSPSGGEALDNSNSSIKVLQEFGNSVEAWVHYGKRLVSEQVANALERVGLIETHGSGSCGGLSQAGFFSPGVRAGAFQKRVHAFSGLRPLVVDGR